MTTTQADGRPLLLVDPGDSGSVVTGEVDPGDATQSGPVDTTAADADDTSETSAIDTTEVDPDDTTETDAEDVDGRPAAESAFEAALADHFDVHRTASVPALGGDTPYVALLYRWRSGDRSELTALLSSLPAAPSIPLVVAGPNEPAAVRDALVTASGGTEVDDYVPADETAGATLAERLDAASNSTDRGSIGRQVGDRLARQRTLARQNELFREAQQLADVGSWALEVETETMELTAEVYEIYELPPDSEPTLSTLLERHPESEAIRSAFAGLGADEEADLETRVVTTSGTEKWVRIHGTPTVVDGRVSELIGSVQDITERHELEAEREAIVDSLQRLYAVSANTDLSFEDRIQRVLELACERLELDYGFLTAIDESTQEIVYAAGDHEHLQPGQRAPLSTAYCRRTIQRDALLTVEDATVEGWADDPAYQTYGLACYVGGRVTVGGRPYGTLCFADTEARGRSFSETELAFLEVLTTWVSYQLEQQETESRLRALQETTQAFLTAPDETAVVELAITAAVEILELPLTGLWRYAESADRLVAVTETDAATERFGPQADFERGEGLIWQAFADGEATVFTDVKENPERYNPDTDVTAEAVVPVPDYGVLASATLEEGGISELDVEMLRILATSLSAAMKRVDRKRELERQNERLSAFTGYVSHDLRNPLSVASGFVDHVVESGDIKELARVQRAHERMQRLIEDMLLLARRGDVIGETEPTDVLRVAERAWNTIDAPAATLRTEGSLTLAADESRLQQVFENVFRNAVEHGGREVTVTVTATDDALAIANDGRRFDVDPGALFDPDSNVLETGLGLSIVEEIVTAHGWQITAKHGEPTGACFEITGFEPVE